MTHLYPLTQPTKKETKKKKIIFLPSSGDCWLKPAEDSLIWADSMRKFEATVTDFYNLREKKEKEKWKKGFPIQRTENLFFCPLFLLQNTIIYYYHHLLLCPFFWTQKYLHAGKILFFFTDLSSQENNLKFLQTKPSWEDLFTTFSSTKTTFTAQY